MFTEDEFIHYNLNNYAIINTSNKKLSYKHPIWPNMSFIRLTNVMTGISGKTMAPAYGREQN